MHGIRLVFRVWWWVLAVQSNFLSIVFSSKIPSPNFLFIIMDDLRPALECYGDQQGFTPHLNKLANKSFVFTNAFAQQALCAPSRNSLLTSRRPDSLHLYDFYSYWRDFAGNFTTLPQHLRNNGYCTYSIGKVFHPGISSNNSDDQPYSWSKTPYHPSTNMYKDTPVCSNMDGTLAANLVCPVIVSEQPEGTLPDLQNVDEAVNFLRNSSQLEQPFFLAVGFHKPHIPFKFPASYLDFHPWESIKLPPNRQKPANLPDVAWNPWMDIRKRDDIAKFNISFPYGPMQENLAKLITQAYYASVTYIDDCIGKVLENVPSNTVIIVTSDHGWSLGEHQEWAKYSNYETAVRVPLIVKLVDTIPVEPKIHSMVELVDIFPTIIDLARLTPMKSCPHSSSHPKSLPQLCTEGFSFYPLLRNTRKSNLTWKKAIFTQYPRPAPEPRMDSDSPVLRNIPIMGYSIRTKRFRYTEWVGFDSRNFVVSWEELYGKELYDLRHDFRENYNVVDQPRYGSIKEELSKTLRKGWHSEVSTLYRKMDRTLNKVSH